MLIQFTNETSRATVGGNQPPGSHMRGDGGNIPRNSTQLRAAALRSPTPVASSRGEEMTTHYSFLSRCCSALIDIAAVLSAFTLASATGFAIAFSFFVLLFVSL